MDDKFKHKVSIDSKEQLYGHENKITDFKSIKIINNSNCQLNIENV